MCVIVHDHVYVCMRIQLGRPREERARLSKAKQCVLAFPQWKEGSWARNSSAWVLKVCPFRGIGTSQASSCIV